MNHFIFESRNDDMGVTVVENLFINHFMPQARGDYVKVNRRENGVSSRKR